MLDYTKKRDIIAIIFVILFIFPLGLLHILGMFFQYVSSCLLHVEDKIIDAISKLVEIISS